MSKKEDSPYNPLDKTNLGASVAKALLEQPPLPLTNLGPFNGAGVYMLYYTGDFAPYKPIAKRNQKGAFSMPIYAGKAIPAGARKGGIGLGEDPGPVLHRRLLEHAKSIEQTTNLELRDFYCRCLVVDDIWIPLGESLLIAMFSPLWNQVIDGFGNHDPGSGRYKQQKSPWDVIHPGRDWAERLQPCGKSESQLIETIRLFLNKLS